MTKEQKESIIQFRSDGLTYSDIAEKLELSINTVKSFYRRYKESAKKTDVGCCKCCGRSLNQTPGTRLKKFCSDECRMKWWNSHRDNVNKKAVYTFKCKYCSEKFQAYGNNHRKYCGRSCYIKARFGGDTNDE